MKYCPSCQSQYTDDTLKFCLQDGTPLLEVSGSQTPTVSFGEQETVVSGRQTNQNNVQETQAANWQPSGNTPIPSFQSEQPKKSSTALAILLTAFVMILLFSFIGIGTWIYFKSGKVDKGENIFLAKKDPDTQRTITNANITSVPTNTAKATANATSTPNSNMTNTTSTPVQIDKEQIKKEVSDKIYSWKSSMESGSLNSVMSHYADRLNYYYNAGSVNSGSVRSNKQKAFEIYSTFQVSISNMRVTPDEDGQKATVVFDKGWVFEGSDKRSEGKVQAQFQLTKIGGKWYITGEKDLKVYR